MARGYATDDEPDDQSERARDDDERRSQPSNGSDDEDPHDAKTPQQRKKDALRPPISSICSALGGFEEFMTESGEIVSEYSLGDQVVGCLKDLKRFWRMDDKDDDRTVARIFHEVGLLQNDLIPILLSTLGTSPKGDRIALACGSSPPPLVADYTPADGIRVPTPVELIGAMTWPINVAEELREAQLLDELKKGTDYNSLIMAQMGYKATVLRTGALRAMFTLMSPCLMKSRKERTPKDENIISLVLHTFRNLAALRDRVTSSNSADAIELSTLQSEYIEQLHSESIFELLLAIASNANESEYAPWNMVALDIFHLIFRCVKPEELIIPVNKVDETRLKDLLDLEGKSRRAMAKKTTTRHSRFGTTVALKSGGNQYIIHKQSTLSLGAATTLDRIKKGKAKKARQDDDLAPPSHLSSGAIRCLYEVAITFLDSAFNPFFSSILKDIRMERLKVKESDTVRFLFLARFFLEFFLLVYKDERAKGIDLESEEAHGFDLVAEMMEVQSVGFVTGRMKKALEEKPILWLELHASMDCFIQILLVIDALAISGVPDNVDVAEILQNKLYYEAETLDMVVTVITKYTNQSLKYLDSVINLAYVLLRMLEKYSKSKAYMYVRKKKSRAVKKKKKTADEDEGDGLGQGDEEEEEMERGVLTYAEHAFEFENFELKFATEAVLQTCMIYLEGYKSFTSSEQLKRVVSLMHRQAVKAKYDGLFFKPTVLELFQRILEDQDLNPSKDPAAADLKKLLEYILKKFFKAVKTNPFLLVEIFLPKSNRQLQKLRTGEADPYASSDEDDVGGFLKSNLVAEVEVVPGFSLTQQIGIAIACLVDTGKLSLVEAIQDELRLAVSERTAIVLLTDGDSAARSDEESDSDEAIRRKAARLVGPSKEAIERFLPHVAQWKEDEIKREARENPQFKLLLRLLAWESALLLDTNEVHWSIPASILPSTLDGDIRIIANFLIDPVDPDGKTAADLLRKKRKAPKKKRRETLQEGLDEIDGLDEEDAPKKKERAKKRKEEVAAYKSAQFIEDSDDEDNPDRDAVFFAAEAALREKLNLGAISSTAATGRKPTKSKAKSKSTNKSPNSSSETAPKKKGRKEKVGKHQPKALGAARIADVSDIEEDEDDEQLMRNLKRALVAEEEENRAQAEGGKESPDAGEDVREEEDQDMEEGEKETVTRDVKKRRVIIDSDDE